MLKFIENGQSSQIWDTYISKHLMLKFIPLLILLKSVTIFYFKTSYVEVYLRLPEGMILTTENFKTSYVEVYRKRKRESRKLKNISKHLMLKFIQSAGVLYTEMPHFKTSYVEVYPYPHIEEVEQKCDFKTSYVEVYPRKQHGKLKARKISKHLMLKFIPHFLVIFISFYLFSPSFFLISIIFTKHQPIFFFLSNISQIPRLYNTFSTFFFFRLVNISTTHNQAWGARQMSSQLKMRDHKVGRSKTRLCMTKMGIDPIYPQIIIKHTITNLFFIFKAK